MTDAINPTQETGINQADYLKLFMQELNYQDPLKPVDNKEFMAQMAQFSLLQESRNTNQLLGTLLGMTSANQSLMLLHKFVRIKNSNEEGLVTTIEFSDNAPPVLSVTMKSGVVPVSIGDINAVRD